MKGVQKEVNSMKICLTILLLGLFGFFGSNAVLAHGPGFNYPGVPVTGGLTIWGGSNGHVGYAGNLTLGFGNVYISHADGVLGRPAGSSRTSFSVASSGYPRSRRWTDLLDWGAALALRTAGSSPVGRLHCPRRDTRLRGRGGRNRRRYLPGAAADPSEPRQ